MQAENEQQEHVEAMETFNEQLNRMLQCNYTHHDIDFCNSKPPAYYLPNLLQSLLNRYKFSFSLKRNLQFLIQRLREKPDYRLVYNDLPIKPVFPEYHETAYIIVDKNTDCSFSELAARILNAQDIDFYVCRRFYVALGVGVTPDVLLNLPRYLAVILSLSLRTACDIDVILPEDFDCTPFLMLENLFSFRFYYEPGKRQLSFRQSVVQRLLNLQESSDLILACLLDKARKNFLKPIVNRDYKVINHNQDLESVNRIIHSNYENNLGMHYFAHKMRLSCVVTEFRANDHVTVDGLRLYLESVLALTFLANQIDPAIVDEIFNDKIVCADFFDTIQMMHRHGMSLITYLPYLVSLLSGKNRVFPHRTGWEALLVAGLQEELKHGIESQSKVLALISSLTGAGCIAALGVQLFASSVKCLKLDHDGKKISQSISEILKYLQSQTQIDPTLNRFLQQFLVFLLAWAQHCRSNSFHFLHQFVQELWRLGEVNVLIRVLDKLILPKSNNDSDDNYYSALALTRVLCLMVNNNVVRPYVERLETMPAVHTPVYRGYLQLYVSHYEKKWIKKINKKLEIVNVHHLLRLYCFEKSEGLQLVDAEMLARAMSFAIENMQPENDLDTDKFVVVASFPDIFSFEEIVQLYTRFHDQQGEYYQEICSSIYSLILGFIPDADSVAELQDRLSVVIMLINKYNLPDQTWYYYLRLMGLQRGDREQFQLYREENPEQYFLAMLQVEKKFRLQFKDEPMPERFLLELLELCVEILKKHEMIEGNLERKIIEFIDSLHLQDAKLMLAKLTEESIRFIVTVNPGRILRIFSEDQNFPYIQLHRLLNGLHIDDRNMEIINALLFNLASDNIDANLISLLLVLGVDLCYCPHHNKPSSLEQSIRSNTNLIAIVCKAIETSYYQFNFEKFYTVCPDPLGVAVCSGASLELVQSMVRVGFDIKRYDPKPEWNPSSNLLAYNYINGLQAEIYRVQQRRVNVAQVTLGFIDLEGASVMRSQTDSSLKYKN